MTPRLRRVDDEMKIDRCAPVIPSSKAAGRGHAA
jgi:hypothetical protein